MELLHYTVHSTGTSSEDAERVSHPIRECQAHCPEWNSFRPPKYGTMHCPGCGSMCPREHVKKPEIPRKTGTGFVHPASH